MKLLTFFTLGLCLLAGCVMNERIDEKWITKQANTYLAQRKDIDDVLRQNILVGKVTLGMFPDEAVAAGGPFHYFIDIGWNKIASIADIRYYFEFVQNSPNSPRMPLDILWMQRTEPTTNATITLTFWNKTQFDSGDFENFRVRFESGRAVSIERSNPKEEQP